MQNVRRIYDELITGKFSILSGKKIHLVYVPKREQDISHRKIGDGNYIISIHNSRMLEGNEHYVRGALATQLADIALEEKVPEVHADYTAAERLAAMLGFEEDVRDFHNHEHAPAH